MLSIYDPAQAGRLLITARQGWGLNHYEQRSVELAGRPATELVFRRGDEAPPHVQSLVWLPWTALERVAGLTLDVHGSASGARLYLECLDADGWGLRFYLGSDQSTGWRSFQFDPGDISASWGPCSGKRHYSEPLQPVALYVEDHDNRGGWSLGLGMVTAHAVAAPAQPARGPAGCQLDRSTLTVDVRRGGQRLLGGFGLRGLLPGSAPRDFRSLGVRAVTAVAHGRYQAELVAGDTVLPLAVELQQLSGAVWILRYELQSKPGLKLEQLVIRGSLAYRAVQGLNYGTDEEWRGELDGQPVAESLLAEPSIWEPLAIGTSDGGRLRIKADGPVLKTLQLLDLRAEEDTPEYAVEIVVAHDEELSAPGTLKFGVLLDAGG